MEIKFDILFLKLFLIIFSIILITLLFLKSNSRHIEQFSENKEGKRNRYAIHTVFIAKENLFYLEEWIIYHQLIGFNDFYLYDNTGSIGRNSSDQKKNKYGFQFNNLPELTNEVVNQVLEKIKIKYSNVKIIKWQPKDKDGNIIYGYDKSVLDYMANYGNLSDWTALIDIDEFIVLNPVYAQISDYMKVFENKEQGKINKIIIQQKKFQDRNCHPSRYVVDIDNCLEGLDTSNWGLKNIVLNTAFDSNFSSFNMHGIPLKNEIYLMAPTSEIRFNHYNLNNKQYHFMKNHYGNDIFINLKKKDENLKKYKNQIMSRIENQKIIYLDGILDNQELFKKFQKSLSDGQSLELCNF